MVSPNNPITQADMDALALLANTNLLPLVNSAIAANENFWADSLWQYSGGVLVAWGGINIYDIPIAVTDGVQSIKSPQPDYVFDITKKNWASELNRIRGDIMAMVFTEFTDAEDLFQSADAIMSGAWMVGINDPAIYDMGETQGYLFATVPPMAADPATSNSATPFCIFNNVAFWCLAADVPEDFNVQGQIGIGLPSASFDLSKSITMDFTRTGTVVDGINCDTSATLGLNVNTTLAGPFIINLSFDFTLQLQGLYADSWPTPPTSAPDISPLGITTTPTSTPTVTLTSFVETDLDGHIGWVVQATYHFETTISFTVAEGDNAISISFPTLPTIVANEWGWTFAVTNALFNAALTVESITDATTPQVICPQGAGAIFQTSAYLEDTLYVSNTPGSKFYGTYQWVISDPTVKGLWQALTPPVPGRNFYLDVDLPPFVATIAANGREVAGVTQLAAMSGMLNTFTDFYYASSMRQRAAIIDPDTGLPISSFNLLQSSMAARPAPYQVLRDTDFVPFTYGFNQGDEVNVFQNVTASGDGSLFLSSGGVPANATQVRIRCVKAGSGGKGWRSGVFGYGVALDTPMTIYVQQAGRPSTSVYDFKTTTGEVTIDPDGGGSYLAVILNGSFFFGIQNTTGVDVKFDLLLEIDTVASPARQYFPGFGIPEEGFTNIVECFSHALDGTPAPLARTGDFNEFNNKPVPQSGHCIFKLRATRRPVKNAQGIAVTPTSGTELVATVGQNKLQMDGSLLFTPLLQVDGVTPFTITIEADARDSGDVAVFWPVLAGNEIVYQCATQIILEAWADWQPIFFNPVFGLGYDPLAFGELSASNVATAWQYALGFVNWFAKDRANYPTAFSPADTTITQFPMSAEIYNDLEALLNLL